MIKNLQGVKTHTTNYEDAFIRVADDCPAMEGTPPPQKGVEKTAATLQYEMISEHPYQYTSDDVLFHCYATKNKIPKGEQKEARAQFFSKGQPCLRASPLTKRYGFGVHADKSGKIALYGCETAEYKKFATDKSLKVVKAMKSAR